jgi:hypothetical protein
VPLIPGLAIIAPFNAFEVIGKFPAETNELPSNDKMTEAPEGTTEK